MTSPTLEFSFSPDFQEQMLSLMLKDISFAKKACKYIPEERLYAEPYKYLFKKIKERADMGRLITFIEIQDDLKIVESRKRRMLKKFIKHIFQITPDSIEFIKDKLTDYAKKNAFVDIFQTAQTFFNTRDFEKAYTVTHLGMSDLFSISFKDDAIVPVSRFEEERQIMINESMKSTRRIPTNIDPLDKMLRGGLEKGELGVLLASPKVGKSIGLTHMGCMAIMMNMGRVAHFVLEGTTQQSILRYQSRLSQIEYHRLEKDELTPEEIRKLDNIGSKYMNKLDLIPFNQHWNYTVQDIEAKLRELESAGRKPDLVVIDYADLLKGSVKTKELRHEQTEVYRDLKRLAIMGNYAVWTAAQSQRPPKDQKETDLLRSRDVAENFEKVRIADLVVTLNQTSEEKKNGIMRLHMDIYRSSDADETIHMMINYEKMIFYSKLYGHANSKDLKQPWKKRR